MATTTTTTTSQASCFTSINYRRSHLPNRRRSLLFTSSPLPKLWIVLSEEGGSSNRSRFEIRSTKNYDEGSSDLESKAQVEDSIKPYGAAKIHDFCFGIPFGGLVLSGGLIGFIFSRNLTSLGTDVLLGGALLALSTVSLKVWRQAKSSLPFVLGQAVLAAALVWRNLQAYSLTKKLIPTGFYLLVSAAMLCFYLYVMISGGNPPPKKLQSSAAVSS